jgi:arylsulfatase A-like enzyme
VSRARRPGGRRRAWPLLVVGLVAVALVAAGLAVGLGGDGGDGGAGPRKRPEAAARPNLLVILTDDQRVDTMAHLPKIRRWFTDAGTTYRGYTATPSCCPSRATIMTGRYVHNHGQRLQEVPALDMDTTLQAALRQDGYFTAHSGKFLNYWLPRNRPPHFDRYTILNTGAFVDPRLGADGAVGTATGYATTLIGDAALRYLDDFDGRDDDRPWYLQVAPTAPHQPARPEPRYADATFPPFQPSPAVDEADRGDKPPYVRTRDLTYATQQQFRTDQLRSLLSVDDQVDRIFRRLEALGELDDTLAVFTSDNGYLWGEHRLDRKFVPYDNSVFVPFVLRWPGWVPAGADSRGWAGNLDIAPTLAAAAGVRLPQPPDGRDLLATGPGRSRLLLEYWRDRDNPGVVPTWASNRTDTEIYTEYYADDGVTVRFREYYDLAADPYQLVNLLGDADPGNDPAVSSLAARLAADRRCAADSCP